MSESTTTAVAGELERALKALDSESVRRTYREQNEFVCLERWLPAALVERMVAEVCLGKVGAVAAREVSRFARNSREWQQLVEVCRIVDTLLIDHEVVYAPRQSNDRLLLGLKRPAS